MLDSIVDATDRTLRERRSIVVHCPPTSGSSYLYDRLLDLDGTRIGLSLLDASEADTAAAALVGLLTALEAGRRANVYGATTWRERIRALVAGLLGEQRALVVRLPESWAAINAASSEADVTRAPLLRHAKELLDALAPIPAVWIVADSVDPHALGIDAPVTPLREMKVRLDGVQVDDWGSYGRVAEELGWLRKYDVASPVVWRVAVGVGALGGGASAAAELLRPGMRASLGAAADVLAQHAKTSTSVGDALRRLLRIRRPVPPAVAVRVAGLPPEHEPLVTKCLMYGDARAVRMSSALRTELLRHMSPRVDEAQEADLARYYAACDGVASPLALKSGDAEAWIEKVHHQGVADAAAWAGNDLGLPELYWDRARQLSIHLRQFQEAARVYRACVERFPEDDYAWHYYAFNMDQHNRTAGAHRNPAAWIEAGYQRAVELAPERVWWHGRYVAHLIRVGDPEGAKRAWGNALETLDPTGRRRATDRSLQKDLFHNVAQAWNDVGRAASAAAVLGLLPKRARAPLPERGGTTVAALREVGGELGEAGLRLWEALTSKVALAPADVDLSDGELALSWNYRHLYLEIIVSTAGHHRWSAITKPAAPGQGAGGELTGDRAPPELEAWLHKVADAL